jgi:hypothetical protein
MLRSRLVFALVAMLATLFALVGGYVDGFFW